MTIVHIVAPFASSINPLQIESALDLYSSVYVWNKHAELPEHVVRVGVEEDVLLIKLSALAMHGGIVMDNGIICNNKFEPPIEKQGRLFGCKQFANGKGTIDTSVLMAPIARTPNIMLSLASYYLNNGTLIAPAGCFQQISRRKWLSHFFVAG